MGRQVREAARIVLHIHDQQVAACGEDKADVDVDRQDLVACIILAYGSVNYISATLFAGHHLSGPLILLLVNCAMLLECLVLHFTNCLFH